ncbi:hypothetical protein L0Z13_11755 [Burkholderia multivorans]|uniref:hypothetical protein n=1 Tax=Burkholderia multivorans TaxID=87883 RepID=UPI0009E0D074|nr:hypothetical protein [Burkholderia multivorans]MBU9317246.1 hypothetical protein [Burkholderia multivorans]MCO1435418.1 hypothetical protein [Burkholderia multivorans]UQN59204.1 hypothetical protein L0Y94_21600 [Burkholderia multivorans]UQN67480.1 hypothetical protein L0Y92_19755 [Burkholderia multivorans]UQO04960.1 hypothetical protein L0Z13_11430 [Burkholderia multivorans]
MNERLEAFFIIWCPTGPHSPKHRHRSRNAAVIEAERLARVHPGNEFYVMQADTMRTVNDMKRVDFEAPDIPF